MPKIKICGITNEKDAHVAADLGVDAVGFVLAESPRRVDPNSVKRISLSLPPFVNIVGVFVDEDPDVVAEIVNFCKLDCVQLHGRETPDYCKGLGLKLLKAIRVKDRRSIEAMASYMGCIKGFVLDTYVKGKQGGTGKTFDWALAKEANKYGRVILSGGLTPATIREAVDLARPYGVDVSSGVESSPGIKDHDKMEWFVEEIRNKS
ncbi:MAG: N-(5'-phosphoribosyl)anthranilate isomerase [Desulfobacterales bacterium S7086C20]|nr:MAG: N-(5'-phosphoribosyl)anthranilate isomerase [Desulfobacterales bacterium S7086C20]